MCRNAIDLVRRPFRLTSTSGRSRGANYAIAEVIGNFRGQVDPLWG